MSQQTPTQALVFGAGSCMAWLDPATSSSLTHPVTPDHVTALTELASAAVLTYGFQTTPTSSVSASPTLDSTTLPQPALVLETGFLWMPPKLLADNQGQFTLFYVGGYNAHTTTERDTWLIASQPADSATDYLPSALPPTATGGGIVLKRVGGTTTQFQLSFFDASGHSVQTTPFTISNYAFSLSIQVVANGSGHPTILVRLNGAFLWSYDPGSLNADGLNFVGQQFTSFGAGPGMTGLEVTGEVIVYQGPIAGNSLAPLESYLMTKWVPPVSTVVIGELTNSVGVVDQVFAAQISIANAVSVAVTTIAAHVGSNWLATPPSTGNVWDISGLMPPSLTNFSLVITATDSTGTQVSSKVVPITTTAAGVLSADQQLVYGLNPSLWLDPSDASTLITSGSRVLSIVDKVSSSVFDATSSETPSVDAVSLHTSGLAFAKSSESTSGFNYALTLSPTSRPDLFGNDPTLFTTGTVVANAPMGNGLPITADDGSYTLVLVIDYNGQVNGAAQIDLVFKNDFPDAALNYCVQKWGLISAQQGSTGLTIYSSDAVTDATVLNTGVAAVPNQQQATTLLPAGQPAVVVWRYDSTNGPVMRVNGSAVNTTFTHGSAQNWHSAHQLLTQLSGTHAIGTQAEVLAFKTALSDSDVASLETRLMTKWFISQGVAPTVSAVSTTSQYAGYPYTGTVTISNGGHNAIAATLSADSGSGWTFVQDLSNPSLWHIAGTMPSSAGQVTLTIAAEQDNATQSSVQHITATALPTLPTIGVLSPLSAPVGTAYVGTLLIQGTHENDSSSGVSIIASQGTGWAISLVSGSTYQITGTLPDNVMYFSLTVVANDQSLDGGADNTARRSFVLEATGNPAVQATTYALDLTGMLTVNKIVNEAQTLTPDNGADKQYFIPTKGPFFGTSLVLQYKPSGNMNWLTAQPGSDYDPVGQLDALSSTTVSPVFVAVSVLNTAIQGQLRVTYQTLGGNFVFDRQALMGQLADMLINQRQIDWSQVVNLPMFFPVASHSHNADTDMVGMAPVTTRLDAMTSTLQTRGEATDVSDMVAHMASRANPHQLAAGDVGLGLVPNFPPASLSEAQDPTNTTTLLTPYSAALSAAGNVGQATATAAGLLALNLGNAIGDDNNATDGLTAAGLLALITATGNNQIKTTFVSGEQIGQVSPYPMTFPLYWQGIQYQTLADFISAVETFVGVEILPFNQFTGLMYFPKNVTVPNLVTTPTTTATGTRDFTTEDPMSLPLLVPTGSF
jgi:hypothetical protein